MQCSDSHGSSTAGSAATYGELLTAEQRDAIERRATDLGGTGFSCDILRWLDTHELDNFLDGFDREC